MLGANWSEKQDSKLEEERRLYYVGMSRARETLHLFSIQDIPNPHVSVLSGDYCLARVLKPGYDKKLVSKQYTLLGMKDLFIDFAGVRNETSPSRRALSQLNVDDHLSIKIKNEQIELENEAGVSVARLSKVAQEKWSKQLNNILQARVVAVATRYKDSISDEVFRQNCIGEMWEVPIVEISCLN